MKSVKHLVVGPFDMTQAIRELAAALEELQAEVDKPKPKPRSRSKAADEVDETE